MSGNAQHYFYSGRSMRGTFRLGDRLVVTPVALTDVRPGDIVVYYDSCFEKEIVHRVIAVSPNGLVTRGDSNRCVDTTLVTEKNLLGRVTHIQSDGNTRRVHNGKAGLRHTKVINTRHGVWRFIRRRITRTGLYSWLRNTGLIARLWQPRLKKIHLATEQGTLVKMVWRQQTVAIWDPQTNYFRCRKPFDLVIPHPGNSKQPAPDVDSWPPAKQ
jgi:signal peptidase I